MAWRHIKARRFHCRVLSWFSKWFKQLNGCYGGRIDHDILIKMSLGVFLFTSFHKFGKTTRLWCSILKWTPTVKYASNMDIYIYICVYWAIWLIEFLFTKFHVHYRDRRGVGTLHIYIYIIYNSEEIWIKILIWSSACDVTIASLLSDDCE